MKKLFYFAAAVCLMAFAACGGNNKPAAPEPTPAPEEPKDTVVVVRDTFPADRWMEENKQKEGVVEANGIQYKVLQEGKGKSPKATDTVRCHYEGRLLDGTVFDSSYKRGEPADFGLNQVIPGWTEGVQLMKEGAKFRFTIPYLLAYGEQGAGASIPPFSTLIFDVELIKVL